ncbi:hypothetical protein F5B22DRAFT_643667 [Xylaria bambusicola]|uniref:uncharacterized protein n=1 Tax=Xylaria bambusicola TaxID=326684 RepID=UPI0020079BE2|nr:uncharacterized protein F5B22DRAFT_643667 [Xylaria bambusicola]KAI0521501.1 hypothetical protein F5B22DRAFT_643667 [Xylaria bambusicola]
MNFARENGHMGCRDLISELSGIPVDRLDVENYGAPWLAYSDWSAPPSKWDRYGAMQIAYSYGCIANVPPDKTYEKVKVSHQG